MLDLRFKGLDEAVRDLQSFSKNAVKHAQREALTQMALETQKNWRAVAQETLVLRNKFLPNMMQVERARVSGNSPIQAKVGLATNFGQELEFGGDTKHESGSSPVPLPGAANMPQGSGSRPKKVIPSRSLRKMGTLPLPLSAQSRKQANAIALRKARAAGSRFVKLFTPMGRTEILLVGRGKRGSSEGCSSCDIRCHT